MKLSLRLRNSVPEHEQLGEVSVVLAEGERCVIGRGSFAQVRCATGACSRQHCVLEVIGGELLLSDLGSTGGTWLDGKKILKRAKVGAGAIIFAGQARIEVLVVEVVE